MSLLLAYVGLVAFGALFGVGVFTLLGIWDRWTR